jgi:hypothetical protein
MNSANINKSHTVTLRKKSSSKMGSILSGNTFMLTNLIREMSQIELEVLEAKIYQPYFISNNTII